MINFRVKRARTARAAIFAMDRNAALENLLAVIFPFGSNARS